MKEFSLQKIGPKETENSTEVEAWEYHRQAKEYEALGMPFSRAMEMVVGKADILNLETETGAKIHIGSLVAIADVKKSAENELIRHFVQTDSHTDSFESRIEERTDSEAVLKFVESWVIENPEHLDSLDIKDWKDLTPWQAVLLAAEIVNDGMEYSHESLDNMALSEQLDQKGAHQLLEEGQGVCRHYAVVNKIVFNAIKDSQHSDSLAGTEMRYARVGESRVPTSIESAAFDVQKHAFNIVVIAREEGSMHVAVIDPTWADADGPQSLKERAYDLEWQRNLDKFYTRAGIAVGFLIDNGLVNVATAENRNNLNQWLDREKQSPVAILNFLAINFFKKIGPERYVEWKGRDETIVELINSLESRRSSWEDENLQIVSLLLGSEAYRSLSRVDEKIERKRDAVWSELESRSAAGQFHAERLARDPALRGLFLWKIYDIAAKGYDSSYEWRNNLSFAPLNSLMRIAQAVKPLLKGEGNHETFVLEQRLAQRMEAIKMGMLRQIKSFASEMDLFLTQRDTRSNFAMSISYVDGDDEKTKMIEQYIKSYSDSLELFQLTESEREQLVSLRLKLSTMVRELQNRWPEFVDVLAAAREESRL